MSTAPMSFNQLSLNPLLLDNLQAMQYSEMTPIQALALPAILAGNDIIAKAKTGSGKTAAFGLGVLNALQGDNYAIQALVICPTRELAEQVANELRRLARLMSNIKILTLCGGSPIAQQSHSLEHGAHIIVGTPGRLVDHLQKQTLKLNQLRFLVLDEADRMLDMGFEEDITRIIAQLPKQRQTLLFSATYLEDIAKISQKIQHNAEFIAVDEVNNQIAQYFYEVDESRRVATLAKLLAEHRPNSAIIFCNTKQACQEVEQDLNRLGFSVIALHGDLEQRDREQVLLQFTNQSKAILVATDVAARGLDIKALDLVINYHVSYDPQVHVHRVGRTGRAGQIGLALTLVAANEMPRANQLEQALEMKLDWQPLGNLNYDKSAIVVPQMQTLVLTIGRKNKIRPGDILGALTKDAGLDGSVIGKIIITELYSYVAINKKAINKALNYFKQGKIKGKTVRARGL
ncbi:ATP-dependent RNA helicase DbpA [Orbus hercynius]|uniref:ATP-dependent RNA helicase DbpA n=1 Tax=Orbus hercynius TaxID=593135 RepID=A0A495RJ64_9GAMM|nr:ATP-dependent RNA helicase DbpA [Orbus hercynius]RKS87583.1 ATP-dependent RNA helicase DbpA [Orbus hercynius]